MSIPPACERNTDSSSIRATTFSTSPGHSPFAASPPYYIILILVFCSSSMVHWNFSGRAAASAILVANHLALLGLLCSSCCSKDEPRHSSRPHVQDDGPILVQHRDQRSGRTVKTHGSFVLWNHNGWGTPGPGFLVSKLVLWLTLAILSLPSSRLHSCARPTPTSHLHPFVISYTYVLWAHLLPAPTPYTFGYCSITYVFGCTTYIYICL